MEETAEIRQGHQENSLRESDAGIRKDKTPICITKKGKGIPFRWTARTNTLISCIIAQGSNLGPVFFIKDMASVLGGLSIASTEFFHRPLVQLSKYYRIFATENS